jgi:hypothetical protein
MGKQKANMCIIIVMDEGRKRVIGMHGFDFGKPAHADC